MSTARTGINAELRAARLHVKGPHKKPYTRGGKMCDCDGALGVESLLPEDRVRKGRKQPKSRCTCGHTGDGPMSQHKDGAPGIIEGHGYCFVNGCGCPKFTWKEWL